MTPFRLLKLRLGSILGYDEGTGAEKDDATTVRNTGEHCIRVLSDRYAWSAISFQVDEDYVCSRLLMGKYNIRSLKISFSQIWCSTEAVNQDRLKLFLRNPK